MLNKNLYVYPAITLAMFENGDTITSLSAEMGIGYQALSARLRGKVNFELPEIRFLLQKYRMPLEELFLRSDHLSNSNVS